MGYAALAPRHLILLLMLAAPTLAASAPTPEEFAYALPLEVAQGSGLARVTLPAAVYEGAAHPGLADLRVFDAAGQPVPFALEPARTLEIPPRVTALRAFPMYARTDVPLHDARVRVQTRGRDVSVLLEDRDAAGARTARTLRGYLVDLGAERPPLDSLRFDWRAGPVTQLLPVTIEGSDDLDGWRTLAENVTLARLQSDGASLVRDTAEFTRSRVRYLRISFPGVAAIPSLVALEGRFGAGVAPQARQWKEVAGRANGDSEREFDLGGAFPVDRLQLVLAGDNAVAPVEILSRRTQSDAWRSVASATFYRIAQGNRSVGNPDVSLPLVLQRYWKVRAVAAGAALPPFAFKAGWVPQQMVILTQGVAPFRLVYGHGQVQDGAMPIGTLVPGWGTEHAPAIAEARVGVQQTLAGPGAKKAALDVKRWALWGALVAAVAVLGWMAWSLTRQMKAGSKDKGSGGETVSEPGRETGV